MERIKDVFNRSSKSVEAGNYAAALKDLIWIHNNPDPSDPSSEVFRRAYGLLAWATLATAYPAAAEALRRHLAEKLEHVALHPEDAHAIADVGAMRSAIAMYEAKDRSS